MFYQHLAFQRHTLSQEGLPLTIHYYLLTGSSLYSEKPVYGIQILSFSKNCLSEDAHLEVIPCISYSKSYTLKLLRLCALYLVTPTDMFSSLDTLMNRVS